MNEVRVRLDALPETVRAYLAEVRLATNVLIEDDAGTPQFLIVRLPTRESLRERSAKTSS